jgi:ankyrin repeat protein
VGNQNTLQQAELDNKLRYAMYTLDYAEARRLVDRGADPNTLNGWGNPFIYWCAEKGKIDLIDFALEKGADINATNKHGETALHKAAYIGKVNIVDHLIDRGANVNQKNIYDATPLFVAVLENQLEAVKKLLCRGADPSIKNNNGVSAAQKAEESGNVEIAALLAAR